MEKFIHDVKVVQNNHLNSANFILELSVSGKLVNMMPGQFAEVLVKESVHTFLRRPFSIHDVLHEKNSFRLLIKIAGEGTKKLSTLQAGDTLNVMYPLGKGFTLTENKKVLLIGGGCGIAPLLYLAKTLHGKKNDISILLGGKSNEDIFEIDEYKKYGKVYITTENGCSGEKGFVTEHSLLKTEKSFNKIFTCGPEPMMKAIAKYAAKNNIDCEVSLENTMACGIGACLCCVTETTEGNKCVCTDGPVFNIKELKWQTWQ